MFSIEDAQKSFSPIRNPRIKLWEDFEGHWFNGNSPSIPKHFLNDYESPVAIHRYLAFRAGLAPLREGRRLNKCGITNCCNPHHWAFAAIPEPRQRAKAWTLSFDDRREIRAMLRSGAKPKYLAERYGVAYSTIINIKHETGSYGDD